MTEALPATEKTFLSVDAMVNALREVNEDGTNEWELTNFDVETTIPPTLEAEVERLHVLQLYDILDSDEQESEFACITEEAKKLFNVPIVVVSLVDMDRQTPRSCAFCAHVIQRKACAANVMVVSDATKDVRFKDNPLVTGDLGVAFMQVPHWYLLKAPSWVRSVSLIRNRDLKV